MKKFLSFLLVFLMVPCSVFAIQKTVEDIETEMKIDVDTANIATLKAIIKAWDDELAVYHDLISKCLSRLEVLGEEKWVVEYRGTPENEKLDSMTFDELVALHDQINLAIWKSREWQEVTVPHGVWKVGEDIPAGTWTVRCADTGRNSYMMKECHVSWGEYLSEDGQNVRWRGRYDLVTIYNPNNEDFKEGQLIEYTLTVKDGDYIIIDTSYNKAVFTPYAGKPDLGFK